MKNLITCLILFSSMQIFASGWLNGSPTESSRSVAAIYATVGATVIATGDQRAIPKVAGQEQNYFSVFGGGGLEVFPFERFGLQINGFYSQASGQLRTRVESGSGTTVTTKTLHTFESAEFNTGLSYRHYLYSAPLGQFALVLTGGVLWSQLKEDSQLLKHNQGATRSETARGLGWFSQLDLAFYENSLFFARVGFQVKHQLPTYGSDNQQLTGFHIGVPLSVGVKF